MRASPVIADVIALLQMSSRYCRCHPDRGLQPEWRDLLLIVTVSGDSVATVTETQSKDPYINWSPSPVTGALSLAPVLGHTPAVLCALSEESCIPLAGRYVLFCSVCFSLTLRSQALNKLLLNRLRHLQPPTNSSLMMALPSSLD